MEACSPCPRLGPPHPSMSPFTSSFPLPHSEASGPSCQSGPGQASLGDCASDSTGSPGSALPDPSSSCLVGVPCAPLWVSQTEQLAVGSAGLVSAPEHERAAITGVGAGESRPPSPCPVGGGRASGPLRERKGFGRGTGSPEQTAGRLFCGGGLLAWEAGPCCTCLDTRVCKDTPGSAGPAAAPRLAHTLHCARTAVPAQ